MPLFNQNKSGAIDQTNSAAALSKKPSERGSFEGALVQELEHEIDRRIAALTATCELAASAVNAPAAAVDAENVTFEQAEAMYKQGEQLALAKERTTTVEAKQDSFTLLKAGVDALGAQKKHIAALKKVCKKCPDSKSLLAAFPSAFQKKPEARSDSDCKVVGDLEEALNKRIASLDEQLGEEAIASEAKLQQLELILSDVEHSVEYEAEQTEGKQQSLISERDNFVKFKDSTFPPLKTWVLKTATESVQYETEVPKPLLTSLKKLFKQLDIDATTAKTLTDVLKKKPADRGSFDAILVAQFEETIGKHVTHFDEQIKDVDTVGKYAEVKELSATARQAHEELEKARDQQQSRLQDAVSADKERTRLEGVLEQKRTAVIEREEDVRQAGVSHAEAESAFNQVRTARASLWVCREGDAAH